MKLVIGIVRPVILLPPAALNGWSLEQVEMALLHELADTAYFRRTMSAFLESARTVNASLPSSPIPRESTSECR